MLAESAPQTGFEEFSATRWMMGGSDLIPTRVFQSAACRGHRLPETQKRKENAVDRG